MSANRNLLSAHKLGLTAAALSLTLAGCFASPDYSRITCQTKQQCPPDYECNLTTKKCSKSVDASFFGEAGTGTKVDGGIDLGKKVTLDSAGIDRSVVSEAEGGADGQSLLDGAIPDSPYADVTSTSDVASSPWRKSPHRCSDGFGPSAASPLA